MPRIPLTIDFESAYSSQYSLSKMTTAEYVLSEFFEIIGVSVKVGDAAAQWFSGTHDEIKAWLSRFPFENDGFVTIIQNSHFDGAILEWILDIHPARYFCTRMAARPLVVPYTKSASLKTIAPYLGLGDKGEEVHTFIGKWRRDFTPDELATYGRYCCNDVELTYGIYQQLEPKLPDDEKDLIHLTTTKYTRGKLLLDRILLQTRLNEVRAEKAELLCRVGMDTPEALMSNEKMAEALRAVGIDPPTKISPTTGKEAYAFAKTDAAFKELLEHDDPMVQALVAARLKHKSTQEETRLERLIAQADLKRPLAAPILYYGAHSGRWSGLDKLNLQNLPRAGALRRALLAPKDHVVLAGDLSQIEARITARLANQHDLLEMFRLGKDPYRWFAANSLYKKPEDMIAAAERFVAKTCILGMGFGVGAPKFFLTMQNAGVSLTLQECKRIVNTYRGTFHHIPSLWSLLDDMLGIMAQGGRAKYYPVIFGKEFVQLPNGMRLVYPNLRRDTQSNSYVYDSHRGTRSIWGGALLENIVQALARVVLTDAELFMARRGFETVLTVHDELVYVIHKALAEKFAVTLEKVMSRTVPWFDGLPVSCEVNWGSTYADCKGSWRDKKAA